MSTDKLIKNELEKINLKLSNIESPYVKGIERSLENIAENLVKLLILTFMIFSLFFISIWHFW